MAISLLVFQTVFSGIGVLIDVSVSRTRTVDLSRYITDDMIIWPGTPQTVLEWVSTYAQHMWNETVVRMDVHSGTHVDAMKRCVGEGLTVDEIPVDRFIGRAILYRVKEEPHGQRVALAEVQEVTLDLQQGDIFVFDTGIHKYDHSARYMRDFPVPQEALLHWLCEKGIKTYATDAPSVDGLENRILSDNSLNPLDSQTCPNHHILFRNDISIIEGLTNLRELPEGIPFTLLAVPIKLKGREGAPCRAVAFLEDR